MHVDTQDLPGHEEAAYDRAAALERVGGDEEFLRMLAQVFLAEGPRWMTEMETALAKGDAPNLFRAAHALKGTTYHFVAEPARIQAERLESLADAGKLAEAAVAHREVVHEVNRLIQQLGKLL